MQELHLNKFSGFEGEVCLPGSKSIANRVILLSALAKGSTNLINLPLADDIEVLLFALIVLGIRLECDGTNITSRNQIKENLAQGNVIIIHGNAGLFKHHHLKLNLENAGTALRPLVSILAASNGHYTIDGNHQMQKRPVQDLLNALVDLNVDIKAATGCPPVEIYAKGIEGGRVAMSGKISSQFISAMMMAAPFFKSGLEITLQEEPVSKPYINLSISVLKKFGIEVEKKDYLYFKISPGQILTSPKEYRVEGDASAATYFLSAASLPGCGPVKITGLGANSIQGDIGFLNLLKKMGAHIDLQPDCIVAQGSGKSTKLQALDVDMNDMPDAAMTLAVLALFCNGTTHIRNIKNLRVKESERIKGLHAELVKLGAKVIEEDDALHITPPEQLTSASIETYKDHRMAMAFSLASFGTDLIIKDPMCVSKTYRNFFNDFIPLMKS